MVRHVFIVTSCNLPKSAVRFIVRCKWPSDTTICNETDFQLIITDYGPCYRLTIPLSRWPSLNAAGKLDPYWIWVG